MANILIIEDDPTHRELLSMRFKAVGHKTVEAEDGQSGLSFLSENSPDLILLDIMMPHVNGVEICQAIKSNKHTRQTPIIILSALGNELAKESCMKAGADRFINKPWNFENLIKNVDALLTKTDPSERK